MVRRKSASEDIVAGGRGIAGNAAVHEHERDLALGQLTQLVAVQVRISNDQPVHPAGQHGVRFSALFLRVVPGVHDERRVAELSRGLLNALVHDGQDEVRKPGNDYAVRRVRRVRRPAAWGLGE